MRIVFTSIVLLVAAWAADRVLFEGRYARAAWSEAKVLGEKVRSEAENLLKRTNL